ncbi:DUF3108 domain-containing protein [Rubritalea spongiae]|uniref:DUF3108 domain-containing protein n=1 Tax=Rubritalea spongiae TaxID=430797 RepID=A0ABW5E5R5_9BACT
MKIVFLVLLSMISVYGGWAESILPYSSGKHTPFPPTKLDYILSWNGAINSGKLTLELGKHDRRYPDVFLTHSYGRSTGAAYALFPYTFTFTSFAQLHTHRPLIFVANEKDRKETIDTKNSYKPPGIHHYSKTVETKDQQVHIKDHNFAARAVHDPITAMLAIRKQPLHNGDTEQLCCHPFASPYLISIKVLGREKHLDRDCIKLDIQIRKIDKKTAKLKDYKKLKKATMWISDDSQRIPIELRSKVFIGDVRATLVKQTPL